MDSETKKLNFGGPQVSALGGRRAITILGGGLSEFQGIVSNAGLEIQECGLCLRSSSLNQNVRSRRFLGGGATAAKGVLEGLEQPARETRARGMPACRSIDGWKTGTIAAGERLPRKNCWMARLS